MDILHGDVPVSVALLTGCYSGVGLFGAPATAGSSGATAVAVFGLAVVPVAVIGGGLIGYGIAET
jgi:hypothetical protein